MTRSQRAKAQAAERKAREQFYIQFSYYNPLTKDFDKGVWPLLFSTHDEAIAYTVFCNPFQNTQATPTRGKIKSFTVEKVLVHHAISP